MLGVIIIIAFLIGCGFMGRFIFLSIFDAFFPKEKSDREIKNPTYVDKSTHYHQHLTILDGDKTTSHTKQTTIND
jgi:hypothetical protein